MKKQKVSELEKFEELILLYKSEQDEKRKNVLYLNLVEELLLYVKKIVIGMNSLFANVSNDDLIQVGALGVLKAIQTYSPEGKGSFKTYVTKYIKGKILQYLRDKANLVKGSRYVAEHYSVIRDAIKQLSDEENNIYPSVEEISKFTNISKEHVQDFLNADLVKNTVSLDQSVYSPDGAETLADRIPDENDDSYEISYENKKIIEFAMKKLGSLDMHVVYRYYIEGVTKKEIASELGISQVQVGRIVKRALVKMYNIIKDGWNKEE